MEHLQFAEPLLALIINFMRCVGTIKLFAYFFNSLNLNIVYSHILISLKCMKYSVINFDVFV